jgi:hypothetical protein
VTSGKRHCDHHHLGIPWHNITIAAQAYTRQEILAMERLILNTLNFTMGAPLCIHFLRRMVC